MDYCEATCMALFNRSFSSCIIMNFIEVTIGAPVLLMKRKLFSFLVATRWELRLIFFQCPTSNSPCYLINVNCKSMFQLQFFYFILNLSLSYYAINQLETLRSTKRVTNMAQFDYDIDKVVFIGSHWIFGTTT